LIPNSQLVSKDYYTILHLPPGATLDAVKKSYRYLAMQYHPDRNRGNAYAAAHFQEVKEAYEVLSDPRRREAYHQQRALWKATGRAFGNTVPVTPESVLQQAIRLKEKVRAMDMFRLDQEGLYQEIMQQVSDDVISRLESFRDAGAEEQIVRLLIEAASPLPYGLVNLMAPQWKKFARQQSSAAQAVDAFLKKKRREKYVERYQTPVLILMALALCYLVYRLSR
jgi:molecular chaperone DnaJ